MAVSSKGQKAPDWGKRSQGSVRGSAPRLIKRLPNDAAATVFADWFLDVAAAAGVSLALGTTTGPAVLTANVTVTGASPLLLSLGTTTGHAVLLANLKTKARLTVGTTTGAATLLANLKTKALLTLGTTTGPAVFTANISVSGATPVLLSFGTTTGPAVFTCTIPSSLVPDVVYLRIAAQDRRMGVNYTRFPIIVPLITRSMAVEVSRLPMRVQASPRLMRVA